MLQNHLNLVAGMGVGSKFYLLALFNRDLFVHGNVDILAQSPASSAYLHLLDANILKGSHSFFSSVKYFVLRMVNFYHIFSSKSSTDAWEMYFYRLRG